MEKNKTHRSISTGFKWCWVLVILAWLGSRWVLEAAPLPVAEKEAFSWRLFLAPFHSVMLHFPIGFVVLAFFLDLYYLRHRKPEVRQLACALMVVSLASAMVVVGLGLLRAGGGGYEEEALHSHRFFGLLLIGLLTSAVLVQRWVYRQEGKAWPQVGFRMLTGACMVVIVVVGHKGGNLTHGSSYLVKNAPYWVKAWVVQSQEKTSSQPMAVTSKEQFYLEKIEPVFKEKCLQCHGPEKQKADYRLDVHEVALAGGESGESAIVPSKPFESLLVELVLLPRDDDSAMPPEGKAALTPEEVVDIIHWIRDGAVFAEEPTVVSSSTPGQP